MRNRRTAAARDRAGRRRFEPRLHDTDWAVLRQMRRAIDGVAQRLVREGMQVLDLGCGNMPYAPLFTARGARYRGADLEEAEVIIGVDGRVPLPDASMDLLLSFQVLEHVADLDAYLGEARRLLRPNGRLILSTHGNWLYHPHPEDHRRWTAEGLRHEIETKGFEMLECTPLVGPLAWTTMIRLTCLVHVLRALPLLGWPLSILAAWVMNLRALVEDKITPRWVTRDNACVYLTVSRPRRV